MAIVSIIPARAGSKRVIGKNTKLCAGKPLLVWSIEAGLASNLVDRVIVSTDDPFAADISVKHGAMVPWLRPTEFADDDVPMISVLRHALDWLERSCKIEAVVLLQPTSPLRLASDIDGAVDLFRSSRADSVVSVTAIPNALKPEKVMLRDEEGAVTHFPFPSHHLGQLVVRNGPAIVVVRPDVLRSGELYGERTLCYEMPYERSVDIDTPFDFLTAELLLEHRQNLSGNIVC